MKKILPIILLALIAFPLLAQVETTYQGKAGIMDVAYDDPALFYLMMILAIGWGIMAIAALVLGAIALAIIVAAVVGLTAVGMVSASVVIGWYHRSVYKGVQWFIYFAFILGGMGVGAITGFIFYKVQNLNYSLLEILAWALPIGAASGWIAGWALVNISRIIYKKLAVHYNWAS